MLGRVVTRNASEARASFFPLLQRVAGGDGSDVVMISHKDLPDAVALVSARRLRQSEALLRTLLAKRGGTRFRLRGSAAVVGEVEDVVAEVRLRRKAGTAGKLGDL